MQTPGEMFIVAVVSPSLSLCSLALFSSPLLHVMWRCGLSDIYFQGRAPQRSSRASEQHVVSANNSNNSLPARTLKETKGEVILEVVALWGHCWAQPMVWVISHPG